MSLKIGMKVIVSAAWSSFDLHSGTIIDERDGHLPWKVQFDNNATATFGSPWPTTAACPTPTWFSENELLVVSL